MIAKVLEIHKKMFLLVNATTATAAAEDAYLQLETATARLGGDDLRGYASIAEIPLVALGEDVKLGDEFDVFFERRKK